MVNTNAWRQVQNIMVHEYSLDFFGFADPNTALGVALFVGCMRLEQAPLENAKTLEIFVINESLLACG